MCSCSGSRSRPPEPPRVAPAPAAAKKAKLKVLNKGQKQIKRKKAVRVKLKGATLERKLKLRAKSKTFDTQKFKNLTKKGVMRPGERTVRLKLNEAGREQITSCESRQIRIQGKGAKVKWDLRRNTGKCRPKPIDLSRAETCDFITLDDGSAPSRSACCRSPTTSTRSRRRVGARAGGSRSRTPRCRRTSRGQPIASADYNLNDGFSPGQTIVVKVPGLDTPEALAATDPVPLNRLGRYRAAQAPVVVDRHARRATGWPIWVEIDSNASTPERTALLIHPAKNFGPGPPLRRSRCASSRTAPGPSSRRPEGFRYLRDRLPVDEPAVNAPGEALRARSSATFAEAKIKRRNLYLAWDFTVSSDENIAARHAPHPRRRLRPARRHATSPTSRSRAAPPSLPGRPRSRTSPRREDPELARRIQGTYEVPCYLVPELRAGGPLPARRERAARAATAPDTAQFNCGVPHAAVDAVGRAAGDGPQVYGHGLLGIGIQATSSDQQILGQAHNFVICATDDDRVLRAATSRTSRPTSCRKLANFPELTDRVQQGLLNTLFLGRLMIHSGGFSAHPAFHVDGASTPARR